LPIPEFVPVYFVDIPHHSTFLDRISVALRSEFGPKPDRVTEKKGGIMAETFVVRDLEKKIALSLHASKLGVKSEVDIPVKLGISKDYFYRLKTGTRPINALMIRKLSSLLGPTTYCSTT
jgi:hypothetical protein